MFEYVGAMHIHSDFSDGTGTIPEILRSASEVNLDFVVITDHNTLRAKKEGYEKFYDKTLLILGYEINDKENKNHCLVLDTIETLSTRVPAGEYLKKIKGSGGFSIIAHPHEKRTAFKEHPPYPWTEWNNSDFDGIEIWNHMSEWMETLNEQNRYEHFMHPLRSLNAPTKETLQKWDEISLERKLVAIGGTDAHAHKVNLMGFFEVEVFPYKVLFKAIRTHVLLQKKMKILNDFEGVREATKQVVSAIKNGCCFVANDYICNSFGFRFWAETGNNRYEMGDTIKGTDSFKLCVNAPGTAPEIRIIRNGEIVETLSDNEVRVDMTDEGVYRVEVYLFNKAWIFSNHIRFTNK